MATNKLTVNPNCPNTIVGPRFRALARYKEAGVALWVQGSGKATLFYRDPETGNRRQRTWASISWLCPAKPYFT